mmetsp:Transcript_49252/g.141350  ORF Transcript_49252/g.141350 Transcript_49252/m.141350 type:complete len:200 (+) Transcript_49252:2344-2943(+)
MPRSAHRWHLLQRHRRHHPSRCRRRTLCSRPPRPLWQRASSRAASRKASCGTWRGQLWHHGDDGGLDELLPRRRECPKLQTILAPTAAYLPCASTSPQRNPTDSCLRTQKPPQRPASSCPHHTATPRSNSMVLQPPRPEVLLFGNLARSTKDREAFPSHHPPPEASSICPATALLVSGPPLPDLRARPATSSKPAPLLG